MKAKAFSAIILFLSMFFLTGCYDAKEIDETAYILALGIDKKSDSTYSYTFQFSTPLAVSEEPEKKSENPEESGKSSESKSKSSTNLTINAPDFYVARNLTNNFLSKNIDMSHLKLIVFASDIEPQDLENHSRLLMHEREVRPHTAIAVSASAASDFLENVNPEPESNTSKYYELMWLRSNNAYAPTKQLHDFVDELTSGPRDTVLPIALKGKDLTKFPADNKIQGWTGTAHTSVKTDSSILCGMAVFKNGKLAGAMDGDSAMIYNILKNNIKNCTITIENTHQAGQTISFRVIIPQKADFDVNHQTKEISIMQELHAEFLGTSLPKGYNSFDELYSDFRRMITNRTQQFLSDISKKTGADILALHRKTRPQFQTLQDWKSFNWNEFYQNAEISVNINLI